MPKIKVSYWEKTDPGKVFWIPVSEWKRFSKQDQKFLRKNKSFFLKQLGFPIVHTENGTYYVHERGE